MTRNSTPFIRATIERELTLTLTQRSWICPECKTYLDRDLNAAINIALEGKRILNDTVGHTGIEAVA